MSDPTAHREETLARTPLFDLHRRLNAKMVPFAGFEMPVQYETGIIAEHLHTRTSAGLFDISHMGQAYLKGGKGVRQLAEQIMPGDFEELSLGQIRYSFLLNESGGVIDDLMVTRPADDEDDSKLFLIVNAACKNGDFSHIEKHLPSLSLERLDRALLALQGPAAASVFGRFCDAPQKLRFMEAATFNVRGAGICLVSRSGYTGEDGFEISVPEQTAENFATALLEEAEVKMIGLGARDSLRLEAGLCLYGHELDQATTPIEANLNWAIGKRRRASGGFLGADRIKNELARGVLRKRVGIKPIGRALAREHTTVLDLEGAPIGEITSGGFGPTVDGPVCMGYVKTAHAKIGTSVQLRVRGNLLPAKIVLLPFAPHRYFRG